MSDGSMEVFDMDDVLATTAAGAAIRAPAAIVVTVPEILEPISAFTEPMVPTGPSRTLSSDV
jgi:hypothetical protein